MRGANFQAFTIHLPTHRKYDVIAMIQDAGASAPPTILERTRYTAYGVARHEPFGDVDGDGATTLGTSAVNDPNNPNAPSTLSNPFDDTDFEFIQSANRASLAAGAANYEPNLDLNRDGLINTQDIALLPAQNTNPLPAGQISAHGNTIGYAGYHYDNATNLSLARFRWYDAEEGRWVSRDPIGYPLYAGSNLVLYVMANPVSLLDPYGLQSCKSSDHGKTRKSGGDVYITPSGRHPQDADYRFTIGAVDSFANIMVWFQLFLGDGSALLELMWSHGTRDLSAHNLTDRMEEILTNWFGFGVHVRIDTEKCSCNWLPGVWYFNCDWTKQSTKWHRCFNPAFQGLIPGWDPKQLTPENLLDCRNSAPGLPKVPHPQELNMNDKEQVLPCNK